MLARLLLPCLPLLAMASIATDGPGFRPIDEIRSANPLATNTILQLG